MDAKLRVLSGHLSGETIRVFKKLLIGREPDCDLKVESAFVSAYHCVLLLDEYTLRVRDLGSKNGTFVNGRQIGASSIILLHDDTISIGEVILMVDLIQPTSETPSTGSQSLTESSSTVADAALSDAKAFDATVFSDGDTVRTDGPETIPPPPASKPALPAVPPLRMPPSSLQREEVGDG